MVAPRKTDAYAAIPVVVQALVIAALVYFGNQIETDRSEIATLKDWRSTHSDNDLKDHSETARIVGIQNRNSELLFSLEQRFDALKEQFERGHQERIDADKESLADRRAIRTDLSDLSAAVKRISH